MRHQNPVVCPHPDSVVEWASVGGAAVPDTTLSTEALTNQVQEHNDIDDVADTISMEEESTGSPERSDESSEEASTGGHESSDESSQELGSDEEVLASDEEEYNSLSTAPNTEASSLCTSSREDVSKELHIKKITVHIRLFITFFQLCYRISERGISLLLMFLKSLLSWIYSFCHVADIKVLLDNMPPKVYFLKKLVGGVIYYVSCPKCHTIYKYIDCVDKTESKRCSFIEFPNHPHSTLPKKCDTVLLST